MRFLIVLAFLFPFAAHAGFWSDVVDAVTGHTEDVVDRITHEDAYAVGDVIATSEFRQDDVGRDPAHWADGSVTLVVDGVKRYVQLGEDFKSGPAPDLYIYVAKTKVVDENTFWKAGAVEVSKLESGSGAQFYRLPFGTDVTQPVEVIIWCKRFGAFIGAATLNV